MLSPKALFAVAISIAALTTACTSQRSFNQADIARVENDITTKVSGQGFAVEQVKMIKDSDRHLSGYVKAKRSSGVLRPETVKHCTATMDQDSGTYIWECK
jgi:outer membrane protein assembly factor BamA